MIAESLRLGIDSKIDETRGKPAASDFWLAQKNAATFCGISNFIQKALHHINTLVNKSKSTTANKVITSDTNESLSKIPEFTLLANARYTINKIRKALVHRVTVAILFMFPRKSL